MKNPQLLILAVAFAIAGLDSLPGFSQTPQDILKNVPSNCLYIAVVNVKKMVENPIYYAKAGNGQRLLGEITDDLAAFAEETGVDPVHDISYLIVSDRLMIANGRFNQKKIRSYVRSRMNIDELKYGDPIFGFERIGDIARKKIAFLTDKEIALGEGFMVNAALQTKARAQGNIITNPLMASLIDSIPPNVFFWFAGSNNYVLDKAPVPIFIGESFPIKGIAGAFNFTNVVAGRVAVVTRDPFAAEGLANLYEKMKSVSQLLEDSAGLKWLTRGLTVRVEQSQVNLSLDYSVDALEKIRGWSNPSIEMSGSQIRTAEIYKVGNSISAPIVLSKRTPPYTEEARKAKREGYVLIRCIIRNDGTVDSIKIVRGLGYGLDESVVNTVKSKWRFLPSMLNGKPVTVESDVEVSFHLY
jgi:TonB family protein